MFKLNDAESLEKAGKSMGGFFAKQADELAKSQSFHENLSGHHATASVTHDELKKTHEEHAELHQKAHDSLDDGHELKAHQALKAALHKKNAAQHEALSKMHKALSEAHSAQAEHYKAEINAMKSIAAEWGVTKSVVIPAPGTPAPGSVTLTSTGNPIADMVQETTRDLTKMTLESMRSDPEVQTFMRGEIIKMVSEAIGSQLSDKLVPSRATSIPLPPGIRSIVRPGQPEIGKGSGGDGNSEVPLEFEEMLKVD